MKMRNFLIAMVMLLASSMVQSQTWAELYEEGNATYVGGFYAAVSYACLDRQYTDNSGSWGTEGDLVGYEKGCAKSVYDAFFGNIERPEQQPN